MPAGRRRLHERVRGLAWAVGRVSTVVMTAAALALVAWPERHDVIGRAVYVTKQRPVLLYDPVPDDVQTTIGGGGCRPVACLGYDEFAQFVRSLGHRERLDRFYEVPVESPIESLEIRRVWLRDAPVLVPVEFLRSAFRPGHSRAAYSAALEFLRRFE